MDPKTIKEKLKKVDFNEMIRILPELYLLDGHLHPQYFKNRISFTKCGIQFTVPVRLKKIFKLESQSDLRELKSIFNIDIESKVNTTSTIPKNISWTNDMRNIVNEIYKKDFRLFNYEMK